MKEKAGRTKITFGLRAENIMEKNKIIRKDQKTSARDHGKIHTRKSQKQCRTKRIKDEKVEKRRSQQDTNCQKAQYKVLFQRQENGNKTEKRS